MAALTQEELIRRAADEVADEAKADVVFYSGGIQSPAYWQLSRELAHKKFNNVILYLTTEGGIADEAYRLARIMRNTYKGKFSLFINHFCKSAGTLMALGADEIIMSDMAELGPLDVQVWKQDEIGERTSGLTPIQALTTLQNQAIETFVEHFEDIRKRYGLQITTRSAMSFAARLTVGCFSKIYQQIDPLRLGEHQRSMLVAKEYGNRLSAPRTGRGPTLKKEAIDRLISNYPSHGFVIDRNEAESLFCAVRLPTPAEERMAVLLIPKVLSAFPEENRPRYLIEFLSTGQGRPGPHNGNGGDHDHDKRGSKPGKVPATSKSRRQRTSREDQSKPTADGSGSGVEPAATDGSNRRPRVRGRNSPRK